MAFRLHPLSHHPEPQWSEAENRWELWGHAAYRLVLNPSADIAWLEALPARIYQPLTPREGILNFGNCVGHARIAGVDVFVRSKTLDAFEPMMRDVSEAIARLPFDFNTPTSLPYEPETEQERLVLYHQWLQLRHWAKTSLESNIGRVLYDPHRRVTTEAHWHDPTRITALTPETFLGVVVNQQQLAPVADYAPAAASPLARRLLTPAGQRLFPEQVRTQRTIADVDTPENRFVKYVLQAARDINQRFHNQVLAKKTCLYRELELDSHQIAATLNESLAAPLFREVGPMRFVPAQSMVLQRREGYRGVFRGYARLHTTLKYPIEPADLTRLIEAKDIATLYEYWCYFRVAQALSRHLGEPLTAVVLNESDTAVGLSQQTVLTWSHQGEDLTLAYNRTFRGGDADASYSVTLRPDIVLEWRGERVIFDAKFKLDRLEWDDGEPRYEAATSKMEDLYKMHTYKDAIARVCAAWVLYPGIAGYPALYPKGAGTYEGIGAVPLRPGTDTDYAALKRVIGMILGSEMNET